MNLLCMSEFICFYACIVMVKFIVYEVIVIILGHHDGVGML